MERITELLKGKGLRVTRLRLQVLELMMNHTKALSAPDVIEIFEQESDRVTIYRILNNLHNHGLLKRLIDPKGIARYLYDPLFCAESPYFSCIHRGNVWGMPALRSEYLEALRMHRIEQATLLFSGTCEECLRDACAQNFHSPHKDVNNRRVY